MSENERFNLIEKCVKGGDDLGKGHSHAQLPLEDPKMEANCKVDLQSALFGSLQMMQAAFPHMVAQGGGAIINSGSDFGFR
ncbi:hypothetical protein [Novosphingobium sp.]|uniref:hypothetical protein n=1 Tax=Novosphingobium sp. TaxID=1874826 RepID=UPI00286E8DB1|nr:hypothetical protein [Novosphingobium sp.]